jgi:cytochrome c oxidase subunit I+III
VYWWTVAPASQPPANPGIAPNVLAVATAASFLAAAVLHGAVKRLRTGQGSNLVARLWGVVALGLLSFGILAFLLVRMPLSPQHSAHDALVAFLLLFLLFHLLLAVVVTMLQVARVRRGYVSVQIPYEPRVVLVLWRAIAGAMVLAWGCFGMLPLAFGVQV